MARTKSTPFQLELIRQQKDKSRAEWVNTLHQRIFTLAEQSEYERKRGIRLAIVAKQARRQEIHLIEDELDTQSSDSEEKTDISEEGTITDSEEETNTFFQTRHFDYIVGINLGFLLGLGTSILLQ
jgi:hypothetical protein